MNIAKLNTASLDDKTFIIKRGTSGGTTINNQDKVVDITENGTTEVVADGGYTGLGKVTINTEVSGGGGGDWHYFDVSNNNTEAQITIMQYASVIKCFAEDVGGMSILPLGINLLLPNALNGTTAIAIDYSIEMITMGIKATIGQALSTAPWFEKFPEITKEEFYSLE